MGGLACAKVIIDQNAALTRVATCMATSILLNIGRKEPTYEQMYEFQKRAEHLAKYCMEIEKYVSEGGELASGYHERDQREEGYKKALDQLAPPEGSNKSNL